jgi:hypothetical protein
LTRRDFGKTTLLSAGIRVTIVPIVVAGVSGGSDRPAAQEIDVAELVHIQRLAITRVPPDNDRKAELWIV